MRCRHRLCQILALLVLVCGPAWAQSDLPGLLDCMRANVPQQARVQDLELTTLENGASRRLNARLYGQDRAGRVSLMLQIRAPADLKGASWLFRRSRKGDGTSADETFVYLPSVGKVKRVSGGAEDQSLFGTALSFEDMHQLLASFSGGAMSLGPQTQVAGRPTRRLYVVAAPDAPVAYDKIIAEVDRASCVVLAAELYRDGRSRKHMSVAPESLRQLGPHWYPSLLTVEDLHQGIRTELRVLQAELSPKLPARYFEPTMFFHE